MMLILILAIIPSVSADPCVDCEATYFQCRSNAAINHSDKMAASCLCLSEMVKCYSQSSCKDGDKIISTDYDYLNCKFKIPSSYSHNSKSLASTPVAVVCLVGSIVVVAVCCLVILIFHQKRQHHAHQHVDEELSPSFQKEVIIPIETNVDETKVCKVCLVSQKNTVFIPCGHICCCYECTQKLEKCPICRAKITTVVKTYDI